MERRSFASAVIRAHFPLRIDPIQKILCKCPPEGERPKDWLRASFPVAKFGCRKSALKLILPSRQNLWT